MVPARLCYVRYRCRLRNWLRLQPTSSARFDVTSCNLARRTLARAWSRPTASSWPFCTAIFSHPRYSTASFSYSSAPFSFPRIRHGPQSHRTAPVSVQQPPLELWIKLEPFPPPPRRDGANPRRWTEIVQNLQVLDSHFRSLAAPLVLVSPSSTSRPVRSTLERILCTPSSLLLLKVLSHRRTAACTPGPRSSKLRM